MIGDDVEIGANTTVDRGTMGDTVIEDGVKLDNQIQVAHNCVIGAHTVIAGCVGIAGSARIGRGCQIGGAAMIAGHITIADGCAIGPGTLVASSLTEPGHYTGFFPLMKNRDWERAAAIIRNLDDLRDRLRATRVAAAARKAIMKMDIQEIMRKLPHRYPIILVDRVLELVPGERIVALKNVTINEPFFMGHFPGHPVMPGVLIIESLAQACAILAFVTLEAKEGDGTLFYFAGIDAARFKKPVIPGDQLRARGRDGAREARHRQVHGAGPGRRPGRLRDGNDVRCPQVERGGVMAKVHPTALVDPQAELADDVEIGPYCVVGPKVKVGAGTVLESHVVVGGRTTIGRGNRFFPFCAIGGDSPGQEVRRRGHRTRDRRRQHGARALHLQPRHRAGRRRDPDRLRQLDHGVGARGARLPRRRPHDPRQQRHARRPRDAGRLGRSSAGSSGLHQFCSMGAHAMAGGGSIILRDIPPYVICNGNPCAPHGINTEGLKRRGFDADTINLLRRAYKLVYRDGKTVAEAVTALDALIAEAPASAPALALLRDFVRDSPRGIIR